ncbi:MAG: hypothetical protein KTR13_00720 [Saprospiraceae bacterium]|nr:hypothetical protein [Saprospiraceae bacterium]
MKEEQFIENMMDKLSGQLTENDALAFNRKLQDNPAQKEDYEFFSKAWKDLDNLPAQSPSDNLRIGFYNQLDEVIKQADRKPVLHRLWSKVSRPMFLARASFAALLLAVGFILGGQFSGKKTINNYTAGTATEQQEGVRPGIANIDFTPANVRIEEVFQVKSSRTNNQAAEMLLATLSSDDNVNVRLVALEELREFASNTKVRQKLVRHIKKEASPLVQVELLNVIMESSKPKETINTMERLLDDKKLDPVIVEKIEKDLNVLRASL